MSGSNLQKSKKNSKYFLKFSEKNANKGNSEEIEYHDDFLNSLININLKEELSTSTTDESSLIEELMDKDGQIKMHKNEVQIKLRLSEILMSNYKREFMELRTNIYYKILSKISAVKRKLSFNAKISDKLHQIENSKILQNMKQSSVLTNLDKNSSMQRFFNLHSTYLEKDKFVMASIAN